MIDWNRRRFLSTAAGLAAYAAAPRLVRAATSDDGFTVLTAKPGIAPLLGDEGDPTDIWGFNGTSPGPTLRVRQGEELKVRLINQLPQPTTIHWHGLRLPNAMDGTMLTQEPVEPGGSFDYVFTPPDAGTFWYHPHRHSAEQVARGLHGVLIVEEETPPEGMTDVVMVVDDWWLLDSGAINEKSFGNLMVSAHGGRMGNWLTVNGTSRPHLTAPAGERVRLRLINAANARVMRLRFNGAEAHVLAIDGQPVPPRPLGSEVLVLAPGGRADIGLPRTSDDVVMVLEVEGEALDVATIGRDGETDPDEAEPDAAEPDEADPDEAEPDAAELNEANPDEAEPDAAEPDEAEPDAAEPNEAEPDTADFVPLPGNPLPALGDIDGALEVALVMTGGAMGQMKGAMLNGERMTMRELVSHGKAWALNDVADMPDAPLASVERGRTVAITMENDTAWAHAMHLHGHHMRIVEQDGRAVDDPAWRDTVLLEPREIVRIAFVADNPGKWMLHCHMLEHQDTGMATWIEVT